MIDLHKLHDEYRRAIEAARDESLSDEARDAAAADLVARRHALDLALIESEEARRDEERAAAVEARDFAASRAANVVTKQPTISRAALDDYLGKRTNQVAFMLPFEQRTDIINEAANSYASYTVPQTWSDRVAMFEIAQSGVLKAEPTILRTSGGNQINFPILNTDASAAQHGEGAASTVTNPVFSTAPLNAYRVDLHMAISDELLADDGVNLEQVLATLAGRALAAKEAAYYGDIDVGTGSSLPAAITVGSTLGVTAAAIDSVTMDEVKQLFYSVLPQYRANGSFICNSDIFVELALKKDLNDNYLWQPSNIAGDPDRLFGRPIYEDAYFDASATGNIPMVFGDVGAAYIVRYSHGMEVSFSRDFAFTSFETTMRAAIWIDAATVDTLAVKHLILA